MGAFKGMIRVLSFITIVAVLSFGAGYAQSDIFLRKDRGTAESSEGKEEKPSRGPIFLKRLFQEKPKSRSVVTYGSKPVISNVEQGNMRALRNLAAWQAFDGKPQTPEQVLSYAAAYRAPNQALMLEERRRVSEQLSRESQSRLQRYNSGLLAASADPEAFLSADPAKLALQRQAQAVQAANPKAQSGKSGLRRIYRKPESVVDKPRRVFRDYR